METLLRKGIVATDSTCWRTRLARGGLSVAALLALGCAESLALRGYVNTPATPLAEAPADSGAYIASSHVPWCVNLRHSNFTLEEVQHFRQGFYTAFRDLEGAGPLTSRAVPLTEVLRKRERKPESVETTSTCWSVAQQVAGDLGMEEHDHYAMALALPGGGSRSAVFSAAVMFELQDLGILPRVDVISSVSGGSLTAGLYARSCQDAAECAQLYPGSDPIVWGPDQEAPIYDLLGTNFAHRLLGRTLLPWNLLRYLTTFYNRTHTLGELFASQLFTVEGGAGPYGMTFQHLNPRRPNWWINAMNTTGERLDHGLTDEQFLFTLETFDHELRSDLHTYPVAFGVTASAAFPGVFYPLAVAVFPSAADGLDPAREPLGYKQLVDGGLYDRLGGEAIRRFFEDVVERERPCLPAIPSIETVDERDCIDRAVAIVLDSGLPIKGEDFRSVDTRIPLLPQGLSANIGMAPFALLEIQAELRLALLHAFAEALNDYVRLRFGRKEWVFDIVELRLRDVEQCVDDPILCAELEGLKAYPEEELRQIYREFWEQVLDVSLSLRISEQDAAVLRRAARLVVRRQTMNICQEGALFIDCAAVKAKLRTRPVTGLDNHSPRPQN